MSFARTCHDADATRAAGESFARVLRPGDLVLLSGGLGAGKTTFVQGVARGLGVVERVTSPTFTMVRQHEAHNEWGIVTLHHADVYRVESLGEVRDLDLGELVEESAVALVEWGELAASVFGCDVLRLTFEARDSVDDAARDEVDETRTITVEGAMDEARRRAIAEWSTP